MKLRFLAALTLIAVLFTAPLSALRAEPDLDLPLEDDIEWETDDSETDWDGELLIESGFIPDDLPVVDEPYTADDRVVIGRDRRRPVLTSGYPYSTVGRIYRVSANGRERGSCTGTLIGLNLVLTNAHCLPRQANNEQVISGADYQRGEGDRLVFKAGMIRGVAHAQARVVTFEHGWTDNRAAANDWAILRLDQPLGRQMGTLGWLGLDFTNPRILRETAGKLMVVSYSADFPTPALQAFGQPGETAGQHRRCSVVRAHNEGPNRGLIFHACDTNPGASGSAILMRLDDGTYRVVGLHAGSNRFESAVRLPTGRRTDTLNRAVQVNRWHSTAVRMRNQ